MSESRPESELPGVASIVSLGMLLVPAAAWGHPGEPVTTGFAAGVQHPWTGIDHVAAMLAIGFWAVRLGGSSIWTLPLSATAGLLMGGCLGVPGSPFMLSEQYTIMSMIAFGALVASRTHASSLYAIPVVSFFGFFHGYAHTAQLSAQLSAAAFIGGTVCSTLILQLFGILVAGVLLQRKLEPLVRGAGACCALAGATLLVAT